MKMVCLYHTSCHADSCPGLFHFPMTIALMPSRLRYMDELRWLFSSCLIVYARISLPFEAPSYESVLTEFPPYASTKAELRLDPETTDVRDAGTDAATMFSIEYMKSSVKSLSDPSCFPLFVLSRAKKTSSVLLFFSVFAHDVIVEDKQMAKTRKA